MILILRSINITRKYLCLELSDLADAAYMKRLSDYFKLCNLLHYRLIHMILKDASGKLVQNIIAAARKEAIQTRIIDEDEWASMDNCRACECHYSKQRLSSEQSNHSHEYQVILKNINKTYPCMDQIALLIGHSLLLDPITITDLRLCLHELSTNTVDHGKFPGSYPAININMIFKKDSIKISYMDNASPFVTSSNSSLDIQEHINLGKKRGLGLHILNRVVRNLSYHRYGDWNVTLIELTRKDDQTSIDRRKVMAEFSITTIPSNLEEAAVIQPSGSIDSSATKTLESYLNNLMKRGPRLIVLDLSKTEFISSAGIGIILGTVGMIREKGGDLIFMSVPPQIAKIFDILNINSYFTTIGNLSQLKEKKISHENT